MQRPFRGKQLALGTALALFAGTAAAVVPGYLATSRDSVVTSGSGLCWHTSSWRAENAVEPCDPVAKVAAQPVAVAPPPAPKVEPKPEPKMAVAVVAPKPQPAPLAPVIQRLTLSTELLFEFGSDRLRPQGQEKLRELAKSLEGADLQSLSAVGYADRLGPERYNLGLSERRAAAVKQYLSELGIETKRIETAGMGEGAPVTEGACRNLRGMRLINCLAPDRRVEIEVRGERKVSQARPSN